MPRLFVSILAVTILAACGGGSSDSNAKNTVVQPTNSAPIIAADFLIVDSNNDELVEGAETFSILLKVTDTDNDALSGTVTYQGFSYDLDEYKGTEDFTHIAELAINDIGEHQLTASVSDGSNSTNRTLSVSVIPNESQLLEALDNLLPNFSSGGLLNGESIVGTSKSEDGQILGFVKGALSAAQIEHNKSPYGQCNTNTPQKILSLDVSAEGVEVQESGAVFALECITNSQQSKLKAKRAKAQSNESNRVLNSSNYSAQHFLVIENDQGIVSIEPRGNGIELEGNVENVLCGELPLTSVGGTYKLHNEQVIVVIDDVLTANKTFTLDCLRTALDGGGEKESPLLAQITGQVLTEDKEAPEGSIDNISFSIPFENGGLDQGNICVSTTASDNSGSFNEVISLHAADGLTETLTLAFDPELTAYCGALTGFDGEAFIIQSLNDETGNQTVNLSESLSIEKNDPPYFKSNVKKNIKLKDTQGEVNLLEESDVVDPEGHEFVLTGERTFNTSVGVGSYQRTFVATDQYGAESTFEMNIDVAKNRIPTAKLTLSGENTDLGFLLFYDGKVRDVNIYFSIALEANDDDGHIVSSVFERQADGHDFVEITNHTNLYSEGIIIMGGVNLGFRYTVTDNDGNTSEPAFVSFDIHENSSPVYLGQTTYNISKDTCISIDKTATDADGDDLFWEITGDDWSPCFNSVGTHTVFFYVWDVVAEYGNYKLSPTPVYITVNVS